MTRKNKLFGPRSASQLGLSENHIFMDTNILIGGYSGNAKFQGDADCLHYLYSLTGKRLYISTLSVAQLISTYQKKRTNEEITDIVRDLQHRFVVIDFTGRDINAALVETGADIEDRSTYGRLQGKNVQYVLAKKQKCRIVVTNNIKDYRMMPGIQVFRPTEVRRLPR